MAIRRGPDLSRTTSAAKAAARPRPVPPVLAPKPAVFSATARHAMIAQRAYLRAERRGFVPGRETEDWLAAEAEVDALLKGSHPGSAQ